MLDVQSKAGSNPNVSKNVIKVALASPDDLKKLSGDKRAWRRQWHFTSDDFGLSFWLDFPDLSYGDAFLYLYNTTSFCGQPIAQEMSFSIRMAIRSTRSKGSCSLSFR